MERLINIVQKLEFWLIAGFVLVFGLILPYLPVIDGDTFYYIGIARRILETGDWFNTQTMTTKPLFGIWALALSLKIFGESLWAVYIWHVIFAALTLGLLYRFVQKHFDPKTALYATAVLLTSLMFFYQTASPMLDIPLLLFLLLGQIFALEYLLSEKPQYLYGLGVAAGLGFLTKGLLPAALPFITGALYCLWLRPKINYGKLFGQVFLSLLITLAVCSLWLIPQFQTHGAEFGRALYSENVERFFHPIDETGGYREISSQRQVDPHVNLIYLWLVFLPWSPFIIPAVHAAYKNKFFQHKPETVFLLCWFFLVLFITSVSGHYKIPRYLLPLFPPLSILCGVFLARDQQKNYPKLISRSFGWTGLLFALLLVALPFINFTHGEEVYLPIVWPFLFYFTLCLLGSAWFLRRDGKPEFTIYSILVSYVVLFANAAFFLPSATPEIQTAKYLAHTTAPIYVYNTKIHSLRFYSTRPVKYISGAAELPNNSALLVCTQKDLAQIAELRPNGQAVFKSHSLIIWELE